VLLQYDDPDVRHPWLHWNTWLEVAGVADLRPAGRLSFSGYEQIIPAAVAGHGVALGRSPLVKDLIDARELVAPFKSKADPARAYFVIAARQAAQRPEVTEFVSWLKGEAARDEAAA
jgi:DNA-binding transcriptional LysR family regulator